MNQDRNDNLLITLQIRDPTKFDKKSMIYAQLWFFYIHIYFYKLPL